MPTIHYGDAHISIGEMSRAKALDCFRELEFMALVWISTNANEEMINRDIAMMLAVAAPATVTQNGSIVRFGDVIIRTPDDDTISFTLPLQKAQFEAFSYSFSDIWLDAAVKANEHFRDSVLKQLSRISQTLSASQSGKEQSDARQTQQQETETIGPSAIGKKA